MLTLRDLEFYRDIRTGGPEDPSDVTLSPLADTRFLAACRRPSSSRRECDPLSSDGETYRDRILAAGGKAWWFEEPGLVHAFCGGATASAARAPALRGSSRRSSALGKGQWPY